jgi:hypothetical protein
MLAVVAVVTHTTGEILIFLLAVLEEVVLAED